MSQALLLTVYDAGRANGSGKRAVHERIDVAPAGTAAAAGIAPAGGRRGGGVVTVREASEVLGLSQRPGWRRWAT